MKKIASIVLFALLISLLPLQKAAALSCAQPPAPEVAIHHYDVVVIATITETDSNSPHKTLKTVKADASHAIKGYSDSTITFTEDKFWGESEVGRQYLLFLNSKGNSYESPLCSPTKVVSSINYNSLIEKLTAELETSTTSETIVTTPTVTDSVKSVESKSEFSWKWSLSISTPVILILLLAIFFYRREKAKQIEEE